MGRLIYKLVDDVSWHAAVAFGRFDGSPVDRQDG